MSELNLSILAKPQQKLWDEFQQKATFLKSHGYYLAGGTALAMQLGHRSSQDFDYFSRSKNVGQSTRDWLNGFSDFVLRDFDADTVNGEITRVKVTFIGAYKFRTMKPLVAAKNISLVHIFDIGLMKILALTHRATLRDYLDMAAILRSGVSLKDLLEMSQKKYGPRFNPMVALRALGSFSDIDQEIPERLDPALQKSWQDIIRRAIKATA